MRLEELIPALFLVLVLILVLPSFLKSNSKFRQFVSNLFVWTIIVTLAILIFIFLF